MSADTVTVDAIRVEDRARVEYRNIDSLAGSIATLGLLHPPVVTPDLRLIAGGRRLEAVKALGWERVSVTVMDDMTEAAAILQAESDENAEREPLTLSEAAALAKRIEDALKPLAAERVGGRPSSETPAKFAAVSEPRPREVAAKAAGISHETIRKVRHVEEVIESEATPEPVREIAVEALADMNASGKADAGYQRVKAAAKPVPTGEEANRRNAVQASKSIGRSLEALQYLNYDNARHGIVTDWWPLGRHEVPPEQANYFTPAELRKLAQGLNKTADLLEAHHVN